MRKNLKTGAIIQARMGSQRFLGKVLHEIAGKPMLEYTIERVEHCKNIDTFIIATSEEQNDTPIADYCKKRHIEYFRGSHYNVAKRFKSAIDLYKFDSFVRINGDSPLIDQSLIDYAISTFLSGDFDLVTNTLKRTYPKGQSVEVILSDTFLKVYELLKQDDEFEHVTKYFYRHSDHYKIYNLEFKENLAHIQLSVDTQEDMNRFEAIINRMSKPHWDYHLQDILLIYHNLSKN